MTTTSTTSINESCLNGISTLYGINWQQFKAIETTLSDNKGLRLSYLKGILEIMSPIGWQHEYIKSSLGLLLEAYMREKGIRFYTCGGFTLESSEIASVTPDESYCIGEKKDVPDLVIEIIITSGTLDKRELYLTKKVPELWFWNKGEIVIFYLTEKGYERRDRSFFLPELDLSVLLKYLNYADQYDAVTNLINDIRQGNI